MSPTAQFKFTKDGITRRVAFAQLPSWLEISAKLESLYGIPVEHVAISYTDADGDEVTLSSQEELEDYYRADSNPLLRRLSVVDLSVIRNVEEKPLPDTPSITHRLRETPSNNTFGTVPFHQEVVEDDWQRIPGFNPFYSGEISSGSGNEVQFALPGGDSTIRSSVTRDASATQPRAVTPKPRDKGKSPEYENTSSTASVLANDTPEKPPVHVYQVSGHSDPFTSDTSINIQEVPPSTAPSTNDAPDPPLAELDPPAPSLTGDVAAFLGMISAMFAQNPQLTAALGSIMHNIGNGAYWAAHRDQLNRAAEEVRRSASNIQENFNPSETDAARRIAEAIGNIIRSFTLGAPPHGGERVPGGWPNPFRPPPHGPFPPHHGAFPPPPPPPPGSFPHPPPPPPGSFPPGPPPHHGPFPPFPPLHSGFPFRGRGPFGRGGGRGGPFHWWGPHGRHGHHEHEGPHHHHRHRRPDAEDSHSDSSGESVDDAEADVSMYGVSQKVSPEERKAKLLAAKAEYKAQKALYRAERQTKRTDSKRKSNTAEVDVAEAAARVASINANVNSSADPANQSDPLLISQGRGQFPSLEMVSVPRRHHTISGGTVHGSRGRDASGSTNQTATVEVRRARVVRKLSDMGFDGARVENRVSIHIPDGQNLEEKGEDAIVADVVDELLESEGNVGNESPTTPRAN